MWENYSQLRSAEWRATRYTQNVPKLYRKISASKTWIQYFRKNISPEILDTIQEKIYRIYILTIFEYNIFEKISVLKIWIQYFWKNISLQNLDTIQKKIYRISNFTIFEYNIFEKISALKIRIQYFPKNIRLENLDTIKKLLYRILWNCPDTINLIRIRINGTIAPTPDSQ